MPRRAKLSETPSTTSLEHVVENKPPAAQNVGGPTYIAEGTLKSLAELWDKGDGVTAVRDEFTVDEDMKRRYGVPSHYDVYWARDDDHPMHKAEQRPEQLLRNYEGATRVSGPGFDKIRCGEDLVLMAIPRIHTERRDKEVARLRKEYEANLEPNPEDDGGASSMERIGPQKGDRDLNARMRAEHRNNVALGVTGPSSPTHGMSLRDAERMMEARGVDIEAVQRQERAGGTHAHVDHDGYKELLKRSTEKVTYGFNAWQGSVNQNSALEQAKRARAREAQGGK